jgi:hypothetical protein
MANARDKDAFVNTAHRVLKTDGVKGLGELLDDVASGSELYEIGVQRCAECSCVIAVYLNHSRVLEESEEENYCENCVSGMIGRS